MIHYLGAQRAYTGCWRLLDNGIHKSEVTDYVDKVTCPDCIDAILAMWENEK